MPLFNIVTNTSSKHGLAQDLNILHGALAAFAGEACQLRRAHYVTSPPAAADINFFLEVVNPLWFTYARKNILIPNQEWYPSGWLPYIPLFDEVWVKTREAERLFKEAGAKVVHYIGWTSLDKGCLNKLNFSKALMLVGKNIYRPVNTVVAAWRPTMPELHIVGDVPDLPTGDHLPANVVVHAGHMKDGDLQELRHECGIVVGLSQCEGFQHAVNEARCAGALIVATDAPPMNEVVDPSYAVLVPVSGSKPCPSGLGLAWSVEPDAVRDAVCDLAAYSFKEKKAMSAAARKAYEANHTAFMVAMRARVKALCPEEEDLQPFVRDPATFLPVEEWPTVSILTPTKDRRGFMKVLRHCFLLQNYPRNKMEWIIYDDGNDPCKDLVADLMEDGVDTIRYILDDPDPERTVAQKRNRLAREARHEYLVHMDSDDYYDELSVRIRVLSLAWMRACVDPSISAVAATSIPMYHVTRYASAMNVPPMHLPLHERVSEATLTYTKAFWEERPFVDADRVGEGSGFLKERETRVREVPGLGCIVSLLHGSNLSSRTLPDGVADGNGNHFGKWSVELFELICEAGETD
jgi:hypothetical protein